MGGEIMFVEATRMGGEGKLTLTGQLGMCLIYIYLRPFLKVLFENTQNNLSQDLMAVLLNLSAFVDLMIITVKVTIFTRRRKIYVPK